jgi:hypothetical protein
MMTSRSGIRENEGRGELQDSVLDTGERYL